MSNSKGDVLRKMVRDSTGSIPTGYDQGVFRPVEVSTDCRESVHHCPADGPINGRVAKTVRRAINPEARGVADPWKKFATPLRIVEKAPPDEKRMTIAELVKACNLQLIDGKVCA